MQTIVLDAGHGGTEPAGGSSPNHATGPNGLLEKDLTLDIARRVRRLMGDGRVILTRDDPHNRSLSDRAATARLNHAALFLSLHWNGSPDATADGTETWVARRASARSRRLAQLLGRRVSIIAGAPNRGVRERDLGVLLPDRHDPETGACLIEIAFLSNPTQAQRLQREEYRDELARESAASRWRSTQTCCRPPREAPFKRSPTGHKELSLKIFARRYWSKARAMPMTSQIGSSGRSTPI